MDGTAQQQTPPQQLAPAVALYASMKAQLVANVVALVSGAWLALRDYRDAEVASFAAQVAPLVGAAQQQMGAMTAGYLATVVGGMLVYERTPAA